MSGSREIGVLVVAWRPNCVVIPVSYFVHVSTMFPQPGGAVREPHITLFNGSCVPGASPLLVSVTYMDFICVDGIPLQLPSRAPVTKATSRIFRSRANQGTFTRLLRRGSGVKLSPLPMSLLLTFHDCL